MDLIQVSKLVLVKKIGWNRTPPPPSSRDQSSPTVMHLALSRKSAIIRMMMEKCEIFGLLMYRFFFSFLTEKVEFFFVKSFNRFNVVYLHNDNCKKVHKLCSDEFYFLHDFSNVAGRIF